MRAVRVLVCLAAVVACSTTGSPVEPPAAVPTPVLTPAPAPSSPRSAPSPTPAPLPSYGGDISWPSCPIGTAGALPKKQGKGLPLPGPSAQFVILGLTNGPGFHANPCLAWEVEQTRGLATAA